MKKLTALCLSLFFAASLCFAADTVEGYWISVDEKTEQPTAGWHIYAENGVLYGRILSIAGKSQDEIAVYSTKGPYKGFPESGDASKMKVIGPRWIYGLKMDKPGAWSGGNIIDMETTGSLYKCKITYRAADGKKYKEDTLEMRGEIGLGIGRSQFWKKATQAEAEGLR
jgi:uncharacterized protein (DUF2147 family)